MRRWYSCSTQAWVCAVEQLQSEHWLAFEHGHEAALDLSPEDFLLAVLLGRLGEGRKVLDGEALEALLRFGTEHV